MNRNDMRSVVYLILALVCFYYLLDDFVGKNKVSNWVNSFIGNFGGIAVPEKVQNQDSKNGSGSGQTATEPATSPATDTGKIRIPDPMPDTGKIKIPQPEGNQVWKPAKPAGNWNLFPNLSFPNLFAVPALVPETVAGVGGILAGFNNLIHQGG